MVLERNGKTLTLDEVGWWFYDSFYHWLTKKIVKACVGMDENINMQAANVLLITWTIQ
jgi:hypothetical protein